MSTFHFDEHVETLHSYIVSNRQFAALLGYVQAKILELFKNTIPTGKYLVVFTIMTFKTSYG